MQARQLFVLAILLAVGALIAAIVPNHPLFNTPGGTFVLGGMSLFAILAALLVRWRTRANSASEPR